MAGTDNLIRTTKRQNAYKCKLMQCRRGPNIQQHTKKWMLRDMTKPGLVAFTTSGQEMEQSFDPGACTGSHTTCSHCQFVRQWILLPSLTGDVCSYIRGPSTLGRLHAQSRTVVVCGSNYGRMPFLTLPVIHAGDIETQTQVHLVKDQCLNHLATDPTKYTALTRAT